MRLLGKTLQSITSNDILYLKENQIQESSNLDYKKELPGNLGDDKKEFLADISSFENTSGGIIIYGIEEKKDDDNKNTGIPGEIVGLGDINIDNEILRLGNIIRDGLDPKLNNFKFQDIDVDGKIVLLIGVPRSLFAPHMIIFKRNGRFYSRHNSGKYQMDIREIKQAFLQTDEWENVAENFRRNRIMDVRSHKIIPNLETEGSCFIHILPLGSNRAEIDLKTHWEKLRAFSPPNCTGWDHTFNLDGVLVYGGNEKCETYIQYFRNGGFEIYTSRLYALGNETTSTILYGDAVEKLAVKYVEKLISISSELEVEAPLIIYLSLMDLKNVDMFRLGRLVGTFDRDDILLSGIIVDNMDIDVSELLRPTFDILWQASGWNGSPNYKDDVWIFKE